MTHEISPFCVLHSRIEGVGVEMDRDQLAEQAAADILGWSVYSACSSGQVTDLMQKTDAERPNLDFEIEKMVFEKKMQRANM